MNNLPIETYESVVQQRDALEKKLADMAAENAALNKFIKDDCWVWDDKNETYFDAIDGIPETPATEKFTRELMAKGVDALVEQEKSEWMESYIKSAKDFAAQLRKGINDAQ
ncbi:hypothetical protein [Hafnia alvei]|uniref:Uncharacterized protein n=1 Tax=Hafnia alvei TaxID=569 RepID=A0A1C6YX76_HAFAL|nr:hypothetical protein [Hafnia alvei]NLS53847.1 hypothetical protein [Hafnia alvei]SCM51391.1 hypothetical protein BN1044_00853 [Hafnia alvei]